MNKISWKEYFEVVGPNYAKASECQVPSLPSKSRAKRIPRVSVAVLSLIVLGCIFYKLLITQDPTYVDMTSCNQAPSQSHYFGTDTLGRDIWSMIWYGGLKSLMIGAIATTISTAIAVVYGTISGIAGRAVDEVMMRATEILLSIPSILLIVFAQAAAGNRSVVGIAIIIGLTSWMSIAKMVRTDVRRLREAEFVQMSRTMGGGFFHILRKHLAPNFISTIMFMVVMNIRGAIVSESTLSFLGIGLPSSVVTWGSMLSLSEKALLSGAWWIIVIPGVFLVVTILCITEIGNAIRGSVNNGGSNL